MDGAVSSMMQIESSTLETVSTVSRHLQETVEK